MPPTTLQAFAAYIDEFAGWALGAGSAHIGRGYSPDILAVIYSEADDETSLDSTLLHGFTLPDGQPDFQRALRALIVVARQMVTDAGGASIEAADEFERLMLDADADWRLRQSTNDRVTRLEAALSKIVMFEHAESVCRDEGAARDLCIAASHGAIDIAREALRFPEAAAEGSDDDAGTV